MSCTACPRQCNLPREKGFCGIPDGLFISKFMLHKWEEPPISGGNGSGALFFSGCNLKCCFCQNQSISGKTFGSPMSVSAVVEKVRELLDEGADNINLVSPTPYIKELALLLPEIRRITDKPIIYNSGGYDSVQSLKSLSGLIDVYLPDLKYTDGELSRRYSRAQNYPEAADAAITEMLRQQPEVVIENGLIKRGVIIRHLVLPGHKDDSIAAVEHIASRFNGAWLSLMRQYTPEFNTSEYKNLNRRVTSYEYDAVLSHASELNLPGFSQQKQSATSEFTPDFNS